MEKREFEVQDPLYKYVKVPEVIQQASGIQILNQYIKSIIFTTDVVIIKNNDADAIMAVYPFTPQPILAQALATVANMPLIVGVGGGTTQGERAVDLALDAEFQGVLSVILNAPIDNQTLAAIKEKVRIPVIASVVATEGVEGRLENGADILNVCAGPKTVEIVASIRKQYPDVPIIATGGQSEESIQRTIEAGANAIIYTPPTITKLMKELMDVYRQ
ncbi:hydrolase [Fuchsiella alkaliacetigena]|uniref:hydrolase n=1 Tax=Fuchsiella alkaliacetigena TaxID=957042 RepID=UPI00200B5AE8|nr:hydrolase [Fuchsiella alkaliacetigena]MCK8825627.1 hydrolase [Fuchsiella alkaliacetigena]